MLSAGRGEFTWRVKLHLLRKWETSEGLWSLLVGVWDWEHGTGNWGIPLFEPFSFAYLVFCPWAHPLTFCGRDFAGNRENKFRSW